MAYVQKTVVKVYNTTDHSAERSETWTIPVLDSPITKPSGYVTVNATGFQTIVLAGYPVTARYFAGDATRRTRAISMGFVDVVLANDYANKTIEFSNGNYITVSSNGRIFTYYSSNGTETGSAVLTSTGLWTLPVYYTVGGVSKSYFNLHYILDTGYTPARFYLYDQPEGNISEVGFYEGVTFITDDPYSPGGTSEPGGGEGDFDGSTEDVPIPAIPTLTASTSGFINLFSPTQAQLNSLASYMWSDLFDISGWKKLTADPLDVILGLSIVPVNVPVSTAQEVRVGNLGTDVAMNPVTTQFVDVDCGSLNIKEYWGSYLDYDPFTKIEIYLPYIGIRQIGCDDVMGKTLSLKYRVDILTGACVAYLSVNNAVLYTFEGNCAINIPLSGQNFGQNITGALSVLGSVGASAAGGASVSGFASTASNAATMVKANIERSGSLSGGTGILGVQKPYIIVTRPRQAVPANQNKFIGYPVFVTKKLSDVTGYTEVDAIHLENITATDEELSEIETLLKSGVII